MPWKNKETVTIVYEKENLVIYYFKLTASLERAKALALLNWVFS
jgi:hypothetical protein